MANRFGWKETNSWGDMENKEEMALKKFSLRNGVIMSPSSHDITNKNINLAKKVFRNILTPVNKLLIVTKPKFELIKHLVMI